jgi:hypothetical protein
LVNVLLELEEELLSRFSWLSRVLMLSFHLRIENGPII